MSFRISALRIEPFALACALGLIAALPLGRAAAAEPAGSSAAPKSSDSEAVAKPPARRLPELPKVPSLELAVPSPEDLEDVDERLKKVVDPDAQVRDTAAREILEIEARLTSALRFRLGKIADQEDKDAMKRALLAVRREARDDARDESKGDGKSGGVSTPDYLSMLIRYARPKEHAWVATTQVVALSRMLERIGTVEAVRGLVEIYARFGEFLRVDTQLALARLGDRAVPALVEARRHPAEKIASWAGRQLDALGKGIAGEAVQTTDHVVLGDVLRAYGRIKDPDAARLIVSFAGSERGQVRQASREAIALLGETGSWQLRDAYENLLGKRPARDWTWDRTARELFAELDRQRTSEVESAFDAGQKAQAAGDLERMRTAFDQVLTDSPLFERRDEMVGGYWEYGRHFADERRPAAIDALARAERLAEGTPAHDKIQSLRLTLEAEEHLTKGVANRALVRQALELDSENARAKNLNSRFERGDPSGEQSNTRYAVSITVGLVSLLGMAWVLIRRPKSPDDPKPEPAPDNPEP